MRNNVAVLLAALAFAANVPTAAQGGNPPQSLVGTWQLAAVPMPGGVLDVSMSDGKLACQLALANYDGHGSPAFAPDPRRTRPVTCEFSNDTLKFSYYIQAVGLFTQFRYSGTQQPDGTLAGSISRIRLYSKGSPADRTRIESLKWTATRVQRAGE
jgi:hypothetical protein